MTQDTGHNQAAEELSVLIQSAIRVVLPSRPIKISEKFTP